MLTLSVILAALALAAFVTHVLIPSWQQDAERRAGGLHAGRRLQDADRTPRDGFAR
ncbi:hypothetical protein GHK92_09610 [Nocardioides sp. dk4132]|uniref:hypothetical protein n=1 Tax=unclassified Nocardioides TaxID=2615069 RepID=UPI001296189C|nr:MULTISPECIES: hypothetical protein [unclassified Nocardioides]MQW76131.1 hypothetical protein [Nocardioides sp. dk4132]